MLDLEVLSLTEKLGDEADSMEIGTRVSSYHYEVCVRSNGWRSRKSDIYLSTSDKDLAVGRPA